jgi:hypothetical protein
MEIEAQTWSFFTAGRELRDLLRVWLEHLRMSSLYWSLCSAVQASFL